jgi:hypothetical protein
MSHYVFSCSPAISQSITHQSLASWMMCSGFTPCVTKKSLSSKSIAIPRTETWYHDSEQLAQARPYSIGALRGYDPKTDSRTAFFSRAAIAFATVGSFLCPSKSRKNK